MEAGITKSWLYHQDFFQEGCMNGEISIEVFVSIEKQLGLFVILGQ